MTAPKPTLAIFDLDRTITRRGTWGRFVTGAIASKPWKWPGFIGATAWTQIQYWRGKVPREAVKAAMTRHSLAGLSRETIAKRAEAFSEREVESGLRKQAASIIAQHRAKGDRIIIGSAAADFVLNPIATRLGIDEIICTNHVFDDHDRLTDQIEGLNCYGENKLVRVLHYLGQSQKFDRAGVNVIVYSDSSSDMPILTWADEGVAVNPSTKLKTAAEKHGLRIEDWDQ